MGDPCTASAIRPQRVLIVWLANDQHRVVASDEITKHWSRGKKEKPCTGGCAGTIPGVEREKILARRFLSDICHCQR